MSLSTAARTAVPCLLFLRFSKDIAPVCFQPGNCSVVSSLDLFCHIKTAVTFARWRLLLSSFRVFCLRHPPGRLCQSAALFFPCVHCSDSLMRPRSLYFLCQLFLLAILRVPVTICWVGSVLFLCACAAFCFRHPVTAVAARFFVLPPCFLLLPLCSYVTRRPRYYRKPVGVFRHLF
jgi:hypothetical protein